MAHYDEIPSINECLEIGTIQRPHGNSGEVLVSIKNIDQRDFAELKYVFLCLQERLVPFFIDHVTLKSNSVFVQFQGWNSIEKAEQYSKVKLYTADFESDDDSYEDSELLGFSVIDHVTGNTIGVIQEVVAYSINVVLDVKTASEKSVLVPFADELVQDYNVENKTLTLTIPEGLLEE